MIEAGDVDHPDIDGFGDHLVVKLADVPHRTELGAVRVGVPRAGLGAAVEELRANARQHAVPDAVAVQAMVGGHTEAFGGLQCETKLGPVLLLGAGGVLVEIAGRAAGRFLPLDDEAVRSIVDEVAGAAVIARWRGQRPWPLPTVAELVRSLDRLWRSHGSRLWRSHGSWLGSVDINPLIVSDDGVVAVDALMIAREGPTIGAHP